MPVVTATHELPRRATVRPLPDIDLPPLRSDLYGKLCVTVDGDEVERCIAFDADAGFVITYARRNGQLVVEHGELARERLHGRVKVRWAEEGA